MAGDIVLCDEITNAPPQDIVLCQENAAVSPQDIVLCGDEGHGIECASASDLTLTGTDAPVEGDIYSASGGKPPYVFGFDRGIINADGEITLINSCGTSGSPRTGTVSVTDACGNRTSMVVRLPDGGWTTTETNMPYGDGSTWCLGIVACGLPQVCLSDILSSPWERPTGTNWMKRITISGGERLTEYAKIAVNTGDPCANNWPSYSGCYLVATGNQVYTDAYCTALVTPGAFVVGHIKEEWRCP